MNGVDSYAWTGQEKAKKTFQGQMSGKVCSR